MSSTSKLLIVIPQRCYLHDNGVWTTDLYDFSMWKECLDIWDVVTVTAPAYTMKPPASATRVDGPSIQFEPLSPSLGYYGALAAIPARFWRLYQITRSHDALVLHAPSDLAVLASFWARWYAKPYGLDVRGDQSVNVKYLRERKTPFGLLTAVVFCWLFAWVRSKAVSAIYVSKELNRRFPIASNRPMSVHSDVRIPQMWFGSPRDYSTKQPPWKACSVGRVEAQKGYSYLLEACAAVAAIDRNLCRLEIIGTGPLEDELKLKAETLGISDLVTFRGFVQWGPELFSILQQADLFVLPSITEGMPRAAIEAMACGLPVIASSVGGLPEILPDSYLIPPADVTALTSKLLEVLQSPAKLTAMSEQSCRVAEAFTTDRLRLGKQDFYRTIQNSANELDPFVQPSRKSQ